MRFLGLFILIAIIGGSAYGKNLPALPCKTIIAQLSKTEVLKILDAKLKEVAPRVFWLDYKSHPRVTYAFMRPQESYEGPFFRHKIFSMTEFRAWYRKNVARNGRFTYLSDWGGYNVPSTILIPFSRGDYNPLSKNEALLTRLASILGEPFYIIAMNGKSKGIAHEIAHGLFATNIDYRTAVLEVLASIDLAPIIKKLKATGGYHPSVYKDEAHAYFVYGMEYVLNKDLKNFDGYTSARDKIRALYKKYSQKH